MTKPTIDQMIAKIFGWPDGDFSRPVTLSELEKIGEELPEPMIAQVIESAQSRLKYMRQLRSHTKKALKRETPELDEESRAKLNENLTCLNASIPKFSAFLKQLIDKKREGK